MKAASAVCRVRAIHLGEASLNLIRINEVPIKAKFALMDEEGNACGYFEKNNGWSEYVLDALQKFADAVEIDALGVIFVQDEESSSLTTTSTVGDEPPQF